MATTLLGCGGSNKLQSLQIFIDPNSGGDGLFNLQGLGGTLQLQVIGTYGSAKTKDLTNKVTYSVIPDPNFDFTLPMPPQTVTMSPTGLMTAVEPAVCTWENEESDPTKTPKW